MAGEGVLYGVGYASLICCGRLKVSGGVDGEPIFTKFSDAMTGHETGRCRT
jgi:hypothetical protein